MDIDHICKYLAMLFKRNIKQFMRIFTAHVWSTTAGNVFTLSIHQGVPQSLVPCPFRGGLPQFLEPGPFPISGPMSFPGGYPSPVTGPAGGSKQGQGYLLARTGVLPDQDWVPLWPGLGYPQGQVMLQAVHLVPFPTGGLSCFNNYHNHNFANNTNPMFLIFLYKIYIVRF